jgi:hypothetical protein
VPTLQRVTEVCANTTGAFGALRVDYDPKPIDICGNLIAQDLTTIQPYLSMDQDRASQTQLPSSFVAPDEGSDDLDVEGDIQKLFQLLDILISEKNYFDSSSHITAAYGRRLPHGADIFVRVGSAAVFPAHRVILGARASRLRAVLEDSQVIQDKLSKISIKLLDEGSAPTPRGLPRIEFNGFQPISILIFLHFLYSDDLLAVWDRRVSIALEWQLRTLKSKPSDIKSELLTLAGVLELHTLVQAMEPPVKHIPVPSMARAMEDLFKAVQNPISDQSILLGDVILQLADKCVMCHSVILRARSAFFADFFDEVEWTAKRRDANGIVIIDMKHLNWRVMEYVLRFMCCGGDQEMFDALGVYHSQGHILSLTI